MKYLSEEDEQWVAEDLANALPSKASGSHKRVVGPLLVILKKDIERLKTHRAMWSATENPLVLPSDGQCKIIIDDLQQVVNALERSNAPHEPRGD